MRSALQNGLGHWLSRGWENNVEAAARARMALDMDRSFMGANDADRRREAETASEKLRSEERIEYARSNSLIHPATGVADFKRHITSRTHRLPGKHFAR